jgi:opacity protein-like surface antigen
MQQSPKNKTKRGLIAAAAYLLLSSTATTLFATDIAASIGIRNPTAKVSAGGQNVEASSTRSFLITPGGDFVNVGVVAIGWELPVAFGGEAKASVTSGIINTEKMDFMLVPGGRVRIAPISRVSPWASLGIGVGRFDRATVSSPTAVLRAATETSFTVAVGGGVDVKVGGPLFARAELRNFNYKSVEGLRRNTFQFLLGLGLRF